MALEYHTFAFKDSNNKPELSCCKWPGSKPFGIWPGLLHAWFYFFLKFKFDHLIFLSRKIEDATSGKEEKTSKKRNYSQDSTEELYVI